MESIEAIVKTAIPGSVTFLFWGLVAGGVLLYAGPRGARWGRRGLTLLAICYYLLALPGVSSALIGGVQGPYATAEHAADAKGADTIVVIGNGVSSFLSRGRSLDQPARRTAYAVLEGARLFDLLQPNWIVASGGIADPAVQSRSESEVIRNELVALGVPGDRIAMDAESHNTREQVANVVRLLDEKRIRTPVLVVTTPAHMRRVMFFFRRYPIEVVPSVAADLQYASWVKGWRRFWPNVGALRGSESAMYEYLALVSAWLRSVPAPGPS